MTEKDHQPRPGSDPAFDAAIDRAVRDLMSVDAPGDFTSRVLARLETPAPHAFPWFRLAAGASLAAAVLAVFVLLRSRPIDPQRHEPAREPVVATGPSSTQTPSTSITPTDRPVREDPSAALRQPDRPRAVAAMAVVAEAASAFEIAPLELIPPITIAPIEPHSIAPVALSIEPLAPIVEVQVEPLSPPRGQL